MAHDVATTILSMTRSMQDSAFEQARWRMHVDAFILRSEAPTNPWAGPWGYIGFIDFATDGAGLFEIRMKGRQALRLRLSQEGPHPVTQFLLNEMTAHFGGREETVRIKSLSIKLIAGRRKGDKWSFRKDAGMITRVDVGKGKPLEETLVDMKTSVDQPAGGAGPRVCQA
jgi:hypothetical protein